MSRLKQTLLLSISMLFFCGGARAELDVQNPQQMIEHVSEVTIQRIEAELSHQQAEPAHLKKIAEEELLPHIDYVYAAYKVVGKHFKKSSKAEVKAFVATFRDYLISTFAQMFKYYNPDEHALMFGTPPNTQGKKIVTVRTRFVAQGKPDIHVDFKLRKNKKTGEWKAFDMVAEGISVLSSRQTELGPLIRKHGLTYVTDQLQQKLENGVDLSNEIELQRDSDATGK